MSYKHNNLAAMREQYWADAISQQVMSEKTYFQHLLKELEIFQSASLEDARYLFFCLPSIIIVKGYALGFCHPTVDDMTRRFILQHRPSLMQKAHIKIQYTV